MSWLPLFWWSSSASLLVSSAPLPAPSLGENFAAPFGSGSVAPTGAYGLIASTFPAFLGSFFVIGAVAASVSTASTSALGASAVATRDIYQRMINPRRTPRRP